MEDNKYDILVVGAGISGMTIAERYANVLGKRVLVLEKRNHIGGNCYDNTNEDGILVPLYGPHLFHTNDEAVWEYLNKFSKWRHYENQLKSFVDGKYVPVPVNIKTVNMVFGLDIKTEDEMKDWLKANTEKIENPKNSEEVALARVGRVLYEKIFRGYTKKQWDAEPRELSASVIGRIPIRTNFDERSYSDQYQAMPVEGYAKLFENMAASPNIEVRLGVDYFSVKDKLPKFEKTFFTGRIDQFFEGRFPEKLPYRSIRFEYETFNEEYHTPYPAINYPDDRPYTRQTEPKHMTGQQGPKTTVITEYPTWEGEPYYPVPSIKNEAIFAHYQKAAQEEEVNGVYFVGRLANYKYFNMDEAFRNALDLFERVR